MPKKVQILDAKAIHQKVERMAFEILEQHYEEKEIILLGIKPGGGYHFAEMLQEALNRIGETTIHLGALKINKADPNQESIELQIDKSSLDEQVIILVDDVANTGKTLMYALKPLLKHQPKSIKVAVLVDRKHKRYPICADFVGLSLATTMREMILADLESKKEAVYLN